MIIINGNNKDNGHSVEITNGRVFINGTEHKLTDCYCNDHECQMKDKIKNYSTLPKAIMHFVDMACLLGMAYMIIVYEIKNPWLIFLIVMIIILCAESIFDYWKKMRNKE